MSTEQTETTTEQINESSEQVILPGDLLRLKRESLGYSQKEIADRLRLRVSIIENIDQNNLEMGQVPTFVKGYLKSYAKAVSLDQREVLAAFDSIQGNTPPAEVHTMQSFSRKTNRDKHDSRVMKVTWGIFAIVAAISSLWWWQNQQTDQFIPTESDVIAEEVIEMEDSTELAAPIGEPVSPVIDRSESKEAVEPIEDAGLSAEQLPVIEADEPKISQLPVTEEPAQEVTEAPVVKETSPVAGSAEQLISMSFKADCWIQIQDATGKTLATGVKKQGRSFEVSGEAPFKVILGAPEAVEMTLASEKVDLSEYTAGKVARFTLP